MNNHSDTLVDGKLVPVIRLNDFTPFEDDTPTEELPAITDEQIFLVATPLDYDIFEGAGDFEPDPFWGLVMQANENSALLSTGTQPGNRFW